MFFNTKSLGGSSHPARFHRTPLAHKVLWAICIAFFAAVACFASRSIVMSAFVVTFAAISWHFIVRDEKVTSFSILESSSASRGNRDEFWVEADDSVLDCHAACREPVEVGVDWGNKYDPTYYVNG